MTGCKMLLLLGESGDWCKTHVEKRILLDGNTLVISTPDYKFSSVTSCVYIDITSVDVLKLHMAWGFATIPLTKINDKNVHKNT